MHRASALAARLTRIAATPERKARVFGRARVEDIKRQLIESCHPKQRAFALDESKEIASTVGRGGGKTTGGRVRFLLKMLDIPNARCLYIATTRPQAEEFMWSPLKELNEKLEMGAHFSESKLRMTLPNGSTLRLVGADDKREIEKLRGQPFHEVQIDEAASHKSTILNHLLERIIGPRLGDFDGTIVMYGTPGMALTGDFYEATRPQSTTGIPYEDRSEPEYEGKEGWSVHHWTLIDGVEAGIPAMKALWRRALQTKRKREWSDDHPVWRREYLGLWAADDTEAVFRYRPHDAEGNPLNQWDPERDDKQLGIAVLPEGEWLYTVGIDMGHSDPFALEIGAHKALGNELLHVYEFTATKITVKAIAELLVGKLWVKRILRGIEPGAPAGIIGVIGWPYGMVADIAGLGGAILQELAEVYGIPIEAAEKKHKHDSIELTNGDLLDGRTKILKGSTLETQMVHQQWAIDPWGMLKEDKGVRNDCSDAWIYLRRKAMHLIGEEHAEAGLDAHSHEATEQWLADNVAKLANPPDPGEEWPTTLDDGGMYDDDWT